MSIRQAAATEPVPLRDAILELSDERDTWLRRLLSAWSEGFQAGHRAGFAEGYDQAVADDAAAGRETAEVLRQAVGPVVNPEGHVRRILAAAESAERRDAAERERAFVARAYATPARMRTDTQHAAVQAYPPPNRKTGAA